MASTGVMRIALRLPIRSRHGSVLLVHSIGPAGALRIAMRLPTKWYLPALTHAIALHARRPGCCFDSQAGERQVLFRHLVRRRESSRLRLRGPVRTRCCFDTWSVVYQGCCSDTLGTVSLAVVSTARRARESRRCFDACDDCEPRCCFDTVAVTSRTVVPTVLDWRRAGHGSTIAEGGTPHSSLEHSDGGRNAIACEFWPFWPKR